MPTDTPAPAATDADPADADDVPGADADADAVDEALTRTPARVRRVSFPGGTGVLTARSERPCTLRAGDLCVIERLDVEGRIFVRLGYERSDRMRRGPLTMPARELVELLEAARGSGVLS